MDGYSAGFTDTRKARLGPTGLLANGARFPAFWLPVWAQLGVTEGPTAISRKWQRQEDVGR